MANVPKLDYDLAARHYWYRIRMMAIRYLAMTLVVAVIILAVLVLARNSARMQLSHLEQEISVLKDTNSELEDAVAESTEQILNLQQANQEQARILREQELVIRRDFASDELASLVTLISRRLEEGVSFEQLSFHINQSNSGLSCSETENKRFRIRTQLRPSGGVTSVSFDDGKGSEITITGSGKSALGTAGRPEEWFDVLEPVDFVIALAGSTRGFSGVLPLSQKLIWEGVEYRFVLEPSTVHRDLVRVGFTRCRI